MNNILVTGGAGFIGSNLIRYLLDNTSFNIINYDKLTYAGNPESIKDLENNPRYIFIKGDICDYSAVAEAFNDYKPMAVMHLAAESHVDRSIDRPDDFIKTNINGTFTLLEAARIYWNSLEQTSKGKFRFLHISTDEVYGALGDSGFFSEESPYKPNSPYSASKASSDHLVRAYHKTYGMPNIVSNCSNNYGPRQFPEKLIPLMILNALELKNLPVYGTGSNIRDWLYVDDHCRALHCILERGRPGQTYNIGGNAEKTNLKVVKHICDILDTVKARDDGISYHSQIEFVDDRPGHDFRYAVDTSKASKELSWQPLESFKSGLFKTVEWYLINRSWCDKVLDGSYRRERLGLGKFNPERLD